MAGILSIKSSLLDRLAVGMAVVCGIHCLVTPILLVALPIIGTTLWVDKDFHLWMLFLVIPTTCLAIFSGCRRHKDRWVLAAAVLGLGILLSAFTAERLAYRESMLGAAAFEEGGLVSADVQSAVSEGSLAAEAHVVGGGCCALHPKQGEVVGAESAGLGAIAPHALLNALGGLFLVVGHTRNFLLCRKTACHH
jgi:hypothetical protein